LSMSIFIGPPESRTGYRTGGQAGERTELSCGAPTATRTMTKMPVRAVSFNP